MKSEINFTVSLDQERVPEVIEWDATEKPNPGKESTRAIAVAVWDEETGSTLRMDLWTKKMTVDEMKRFAVESMGGLAMTVRNATGDNKMAERMEALCREFVKEMQEEGK